MADLSILDANSLEDVSACNGIKLIIPGGKAMPRDSLSTMGIKKS